MDWWRRNYLSFRVLPVKKRVSSSLPLRNGGRHLLAHVNRPESSSATKVHDSRTASDLGDQPRRVQAQPSFVVEEVVVYIHPMTFLLGLSVSVCRRQANAYIGESLKESGSPRHVGTCIDPSAMHGTSAHSLHTILAALVLLRKRTCGKKRVRNCVTVGCKNDEVDGLAEAR
jgi:hypothetical protein